MTYVVTISRAKEWKLECNSDCSEAFLGGGNFIHVKVVGD